MDEWTQFRTAIAGAVLSLVFVTVAIYSLYMDIVEYRASRAGSSLEDCLSGDDVWDYDLPLDESNVLDELELLQALRYTGIVTDDSEFVKGFYDLLSVQVEDRERDCDFMQLMVANHVNALGHFMNPLWVINVQNLQPDCPTVYGALKSLWERYKDFNPQVQANLCYLTQTLTYQFDPKKTPGGMEFLEAQVVLGECVDYNYGSSGYEVKMVDLD